MSQKIVIRADIKAKVKYEDGICIVYNKRYNISGYGKTFLKARDMFLIAIDDALIFRKPIKQ